MIHEHSIYDTDTHFSISPITRAIKNESFSKTRLMQYDHNSERFTFEIPRVIEGHDMSECTKIEIHYINIDASTKQTNSDVYLVDDKSLSPESEDMVIFSWLISKNATLYAGSLNFVIRFVCLRDDVIDYQWSSDIHRGIAVGESINNGEALIEEYSDILEAWKEEALKNLNTESSEILEAWKNGALQETLTEWEDKVVAKATEMTKEHFVPRMSVLDEEDGNDEYIDFSQMYNRVLVELSRDRGVYSRYVLSGNATPPIDPNGTAFVYGEGTYYGKRSNGGYDFAEAESVIGSGVIGGLDGKFNKNVGIDIRGTTYPANVNIVDLGGGIGKVLEYARTRSANESEIAFICNSTGGGAKTVFEADVLFNCSDVTTDDYLNIIRFSFLNGKSANTPSYAWSLTDSQQIMWRANDVIIMPDNSTKRTQNLRPSNAANNRILVKKNEWARIRFEQVGTHIGVFINDMHVHTLSARAEITDFYGINLTFLAGSADAKFYFNHIYLGQVDETSISQGARLSSVVERANTGDIYVPRIPSSNDAAVSLYYLLQAIANAKTDINANMPLKKDVGANSISGAGSSGLVKGEGGIGIGYRCNVTGKRAIGIGSELNVAHELAIALGYALKTSAASQIVLGRYSKDNPDAVIIYANEKGNIFEVLKDGRVKTATPKNDNEAATKGYNDTQLSNHNENATAHSDIRTLITDLTTKLNAIANSDDVSLDQLKEIVAYIKNNKNLIDSITTSKVSIADIVDDLNGASDSDKKKPLSAHQGYKLNQKLVAMEKIEVPTTLAQLQEDEEHRTVTDEDIEAWNAKSDRAVPVYLDDLLASETGSQHVSLEEKNSWNGKADKKDIPDYVTNINAQMGDGVYPTCNAVINYIASLITSTYTLTNNTLSPSYTSYIPNFGAVAGYVKKMLGLHKYSYDDLDNKPTLITSTDVTNAIKTVVDKFTYNPTGSMNSQKFSSGMWRMTLRLGSSDYYPLGLRHLRLDEGRNILTVTAVDGTTVAAIIATDGTISFKKNGADWTTADGSIYLLANKVNVNE